MQTAPQCLKPNITYNSYTFQTHFFPMSCKILKKTLLGLVHDRNSMKLVRNQKIALSDSTEFIGAIQTNLSTSLSK